MPWFSFRENTLFYLEKVKEIIGSISSTYATELHVPLKIGMAKGLSLAKKYQWCDMCHMNI